MSSPENLSWQIKIPLINNRFIIGNIVKSIAMVLLLFFIIIGSIFGWADGIKGVVHAFVACLLGGVFLAIISVFTLAVFLGNKYLLEFAINEKGVIMKSRSDRAHFAHRFALILGLLGRNPAAVGAGAAGIAGETSIIPWNKIKSIKSYPDKKTIRLKRNFLETMFVYCTEENFEGISALIARKSTENKGRPDRISSVSSDMRGDSPKESMENIARPQEPVPFSLSQWVLIMFIPGINVIAIFFSPLVKWLKIFISVINVIFIISIIWAVGFASDPDNAKLAVGSLGFVLCVLYWISLVYSWNIAKADCKAKMKSMTIDKKVPLWLWGILVLVCASGIAFFSIFRSPSHGPVKEELTPGQKEAIFSDIRKENFKAPEPERSNGPSLPQ